MPPDWERQTVQDYLESLLSALQACCSWMSSCVTSSLVRNPEAQLQKDSTNASILRIDIPSQRIANPLTPPWSFTRSYREGTRIARCKLIMLQNHGISLLILMDLQKHRVRSLALVDTAPHPLNLDMMAYTEKNHNNSRRTLTWKCIPQKFFYSTMALS